MLSSAQIVQSKFFFPGNNSIFDQPFVNLLSAHHIFPRHNIFIKQWKRRPQRENKRQRVSF